MLAFNFGYADHLVRALIGAGTIAATPIIAGIAGGTVPA